MPALGHLQSRSKEVLAPLLMVLFNINLVETKSYSPDLQVLLHLSHTDSSESWVIKDTELFYFYELNILTPFVQIKANYSITLI